MLSLSVVVLVVGWSGKYKGVEGDGLSLLLQQKI